MNTTNSPTTEPPAAPASNGSPALPQRLAFTLRETAALLGISEKSVRRLIARGLIRPSRALRHLLIPRKEIERFLNDTVG